MNSQEVENKAGNLIRRMFLIILIAVITLGIGSYNCQQQPEEEEEEEDLESYETINGIEIQRKVIKDLLELNIEYTQVIVVLDDTSHVGDISEDENLKKQAEIFSQDQKAVLIILNTNDFKLRYNFSILNGFSGDLSKSGLEKLIEYDNNIKRIEGKTIFHTN